MYLDQLGQSFYNALVSDATRTLVTIGIALLTTSVALLATRRKNTREDRQELLKAIKPARRFQAKREYYDLDADLYALSDALVPFRALAGHARLFGELSRLLWRDSRTHWEEHEGEPGAGAYDAATAKALDAVTAALTGRVRAARWRQRWGARRELRRLTQAASLPEQMTLGYRPGSGNTVVDPSGFITSKAELRGYVAGRPSSRESPTSPPP